MATYSTPDDSLYTEQDEWVRWDDDSVFVGITDYAQQQLGDIVFMELPEVGSGIDRGDSFGVIESVKAVSDLYAPVSGKVVEVNAELTDRPEAINEDCYGDGWMIAVEIGHAEELESLLDAKTYQDHVLERGD